MNKRGSFLTVCLGLLLFIPGITRAEKNPEVIQFQLQQAQLVLNLQLSVEEDEPLFRRYVHAKEQEWLTALENWKEQHHQTRAKEENYLILFLFSGEISQGDRGLRVNDLQQALGLLGYELVQDGIFGPQTQQKLLVFQEDHGLPVSGRLDKATAEKLNHALNQQGITEPVGIKAAHPPTQGYWVAVNKSTNRLLLFQGERAIADYPVASGKNASLTPEGQFKIVFKAIDPAWGGAGIAPPVAGGHPDNPLGSRWLGLDIGGGGTYGIHGTNNPASIGTYASLGCVRMHNHDVEYLYELLPEHTPVWIGSTQQLENWGIR